MGLLGIGVMLTVFVAGCSSSQPSDEATTGPLGEVTPTPSATPAPVGTPGPTAEPSEESTIEVDRQALVDLYNATGGPNWTFETNWLSEEPIGTWGGVSTAADGRVIELNLSSNGLRNEIPPQLAELSSLVALRLSG